MRPPALPRFEGGQRLWMSSAGVGVVGLVATGVGALLDVREALYGYLFGFIYWLGLCLGTLLLLASFHASNARWPVVLRRTLEVTGATVPVFLVLFVPVGLGMARLYPWVTPSPELGEHALQVLAHREPYNTVPRFLLRAVGYFLAWGLVGHFLLRWSVRQDTEGSTRWTAWQRRLGSGALPVIGLAFSFMTLDWLMALDATWQSTVYGIYVYSGATVGALALVVVAGVATRDTQHFGRLLTPGHYQRLGTLLFAFICFWAYIAYSQYMLIWVASLPEEVTWYLVRMHGGWGAVSWALILGHFVLPFAVLLSRELKQRPRALAGVALWMLLLHAVDTAWLVLPALSPSRAHLPWTALTAWVGVGGCAVAFAVWRSRGMYPVPVGDPFLVHSLQVRQP
ncbi:hypothetical protein DRW03_17185 [Corallococcus sp. H22C18031201]|uniref:hypothetical protein n=1 Tax=Citreicoccus inhibens TaxID=2849499 RepID=UPI000E73B558|nr:hypothetical protein [Citreicoccus inhibens]MBU8897289.1 hypothetical protein [Citreicoccus inhibens]RJS21151.1 hypothetical protein DRW03_17185 [Corallococcus sp. H22C18031201]